MTRRRRLALALGTVIALLAVLAGAAAWVAVTEAGLRWAAGVARSYLPAGVSFEHAEGRLVGPLALTGVAVRGEGATVRVARIELDWRPRALWTSEIRVSRLALRGVEIELAGGETAGRLRLPPPPDDIGLPAEIVLDRVTVDDVAIRYPPDGRLRLDHVALAARAGPDRLRLTALRVRAPLLDADGALALGARAPHRVEGRLEWRARPPGEIAAMAGVLELDGRLSDLRLEQRWHQPARARLDARLRVLGIDPGWQAQLELPRGPLQAWSPGLPSQSAAASLALEGSLDAVTIAGTVDVFGTPVGAVRARGRLRATAAAVTIERLRLEPERSSAWAEVTGDVALAPGPRFDLRGRWHGLTWPLDAPAAAALRSPGGELALRGAPDDYALDAEGRIVTRWTGSEAVTVEATGTGSLEALMGIRASAAWRGARVEASGDLRWAEPGRARARLRLSGIDPARIAGGPPGRIGAAATVELAWTEGPAGHLTLEGLDGTVDGRPVTGRGRLDYGAGRWRVEGLRLAVAGSRLEVSGAIGAVADLDWAVDVPALGRLLPGASGRIAGSGSVDGDPRAPVVAVDVAGDGLAVGDARVGAARLAGRFAPLGGPEGHLELRLAGVAARGIAIEQLQARLTGGRGAHRLELRASSDRGRVDLALTGSAGDSGWSGRLEAAALDSVEFGTWRLVAPAALEWRGGEARLARACWQRGRARACAVAAGGPDGWRAELDVDAVPVAWVGEQWRSELAYEGRLAATATLAQRAGARVTGRARLDLTRGAVAGVLDDEMTTLLAYERSHVEAELEPGRATARVAVALAGGGRVDAELELGRSGQQPLDGRVRARIDDLALVTVLVPQVGRAEGRLVADLGIGGRLDAPSASGSARLAQGRVVLEPLGVDLRGLEAGITTTDGAFEVRAVARSGGGRVTADLRLEPGAGGWRGAGRIAGKDFTAVDLPELHAVVSPQLQWRLDGRAIDVEGTVDVPSARIEPRDISRTVQTSPDAVVIGPDGEPIEAEAPAWRVSADLRLTLGDEVAIDAFGLRGRLTGALDIVERPGKLTTATGELRVVEGSYSVYRQTLEIVRGRVLFDGGPVANPGLDVRAVRRPGSVVVGVNVRGSLREPRVTLFSEPPMEDTQVLSYLIAGVPLADASADEQSTLAAAAAALTRSRQGRQLADQFGIDELGVEPGAEGQGASVVLGRYLSPRLYVGYGIGLAEQVNSVRMRYDLTQQWALEARSGATSSADLLYTIESETTGAVLEGLVPD